MKLNKFLDQINILTEELVAADSDELNNLQAATRSNQHLKTIIYTKRKTFTTIS
jgi:hypothetical protein